jgi:hypothetical protein
MKDEGFADGHREIQCDGRKPFIQLSKSTANVRRRWPDLPWCQAVVAESASGESPINTFHTNLYTEPTIGTPRSMTWRGNRLAQLWRVLGAHSRGGGGR